ncbi:MAG: FAD-dependent oxidoreductase, partial [Planctomycetota bacterium]
MDRAKSWLARGFLCLFVLISAFGCSSATRSDRESFDVVVLGGTSGGIAAAVQAARMGKSVVLIESTEHLGGLTSGGLGATDIGNKKAIGGIAREFYHRVYLHYVEEDSWVYEDRRNYRRREEYGRGRAESWDREGAWWMFEPHVAEAIFEEIIREAGVSVIYGERLELGGGVQKEGLQIVAIKTESGEVFRGKMFIDATYEGDLMAKAGVSYAVGRESNTKYGETLNGVQTQNARYHQFEKPVDPYVKRGDPSSGLLPRLHGEGPGIEGEGDHRVQAYCFRMCLTDVVENKVAFAKPEDYDELRYELLLRYYEAGYDDIPWLPHMMPNRKTDTNNRHGFSTDNIGMNYDYPDANYAARERIIAEHASYQKGLMWTLANHPRV